MYRNWIASYLSWLAGRGIEPATARARAALGFTAVALGNLGALLLVSSKIGRFALHAGLVTLTFLLGAVGFAIGHAMEIQRLARRAQASQARSYAWVGYIVVSGVTWFLAIVIFVRPD